MNRKIYKFLILFSFIFLSFITNINGVNAVTYTVKLDGNESTTKGSTSTTVETNDKKLSKITLPKKKVTITYVNNTGATISGGDKEKQYTLNGWYTQITGGSKVANNSKSPVLEKSVSEYTDSLGQWTRTSGATLYAHWDPLTVNLPTITKNGKVCGWNTDFEGTTYVQSGGTWKFFSATSRTFTATCSDTASYCDNEPYECISCTYIIKASESKDNKEHVYTYYAKSDAQGNVSVTGEGDSVIKAANDPGYFYEYYNNNGYKLKCPNMYYQYDIENSGYYTLTFQQGKTQIDPIDGTTYESKFIIPIIKSNEKPFGDEGTSENITTCDVPVMYQKQNTDDYIKAASSAKAIVRDNNISVASLPYPDAMKMLENNPISSTVSISDFENGCPNDLLVFCKISSDYNYDNSDGKYACSLNKATDVEVSSSGLQYYQIDNPTGLNNLFRLSSYDITCDDVEQLHIIWIMLWVGAPILLIIMGTVDYFRAIISGDAETMKKVKKKFPKRIVALIALIFTPAVITIIVNIVQSNKKSDLGKTSDVSLMYCIVNGNK